MAAFYDLPASKSLASSRFFSALGAPLSLSDTHITAKSPSPSRRIAILTGGGSGHEPFPTGFLGRGLADAAVPGPIFTSPPAPSVAAALADLGARRPRRPNALVIIALNYAGDVLSFRRGAEMYADSARDRGEEALDVHFCFVADDLAIDKEERRGLAGAAAVLKIAGAAADEGMTGAEVAVIARGVSVGTIGAALGHATVPGGEERRVVRGVSIGLGIHNEVGWAEVGTADMGDSVASGVVELVCGRLEEEIGARGMLKGCGSIFVMLNNLGSVSELGMGVLGAAVAEFLFGEREEGALAGGAGGKRVYLAMGKMVSSLDMNGFSVSVVGLTQESVRLLLAPTEASAWPRVSEVRQDDYRRERTSAFSFEGTSMAEDCGLEANSPNGRVIVRVSDALLKRAPDLGQLDSLIGDGDFGDTLTSGATALRAAASEGLFDALSSPDELLRSIAKIVGRSMGGTSGNLTQVFFDGASKALISGSASEVSVWSRCLVAGTYAVQSVGKAAVGDRTAVDALCPAATAARDGGSMAEVAEAAENGAWLTRGLVKARFGRAANLNRQCLRGNTDPGALAVGIALRAFADAWSSECL